MSATASTLTSGRFFFLDLSIGRILSANPDGSDLKTVLNEGRRLPDGLALDVRRPYLLDQYGRQALHLLPIGTRLRRAEKRKSDLCVKTFL